MIAKKSLPEKSKGVGYYFYETTKGIYFRSWDNMVSVKGSHDRDTKQIFRYMPMNVNDDTIKIKSITTINQLNHIDLSITFTISLQIQL